MGECKHCHHDHEHDHGKENIKEEIIKLSIALIIFIIAIIKIIPGNLTIWLYIISYILSGYEVLIKSVKNMFKGELFDENFLMSIATIGAFLINKPVEAVAVMVFYNIGEVFQDIATGKTKKSIISLMDIKPKIANLKIDSQIKKVNPEELKIGDIIIVKPGEKVPVDGIIIKGESSINTSTLTGEHIPKKVAINDEILAGSINENGVIELEVTKEFKDTAINQIIELVKNSNKNKSKTEMFITRFAKIYTPIVVILALILAFIPPIIVGDLNEWIRRALIFLVTSCPCAIVLSVPLAYFAGIRKRGKRRCFG